MPIRRSKTKATYIKGMLAGRKAAFTEAAAFAREYGMETLRDDIALVNSQSYESPVNWDSENPEDNEDHPHTLEINIAQSQAFHFMVLEKRLMELAFGMIQAYGSDCGQRRIMD